MRLPMSTVEILRRKISLLKLIFQCTRKTESGNISLLDHRNMNMVTRNLVSTVSKCPFP